MKKSTAAAAAGAVALTVTGAVSALFMTVGASQGSEASGEEPAVVTEYVDQDGNPVDAPVATTSTPEIVVVDAAAADAVPATDEDESEEYDDEEYESEGYESEEYESEEYEDEELEEDDD